MKTLYKVQYHHPNWGWSLYDCDLTRDEVEDGIRRAVNAGLTDAYDEVINPLQIRVLKYANPEIILTTTIDIDKIYGIIILSKGDNDG